ncbi:glycosyltransferase [Xanthobacter flavus]|uniref:glycosyltransferase n=1 Tax=Xanthobacter flavus TaxID=281 RepID=UPI00372AF7AC
MAKASDLPKAMNVAPAPRKLRIGFVYSRVPFPMMRGDQLTVAHLISFLSARGHDIDFHTLDVDGQMDPAQEAWLKGACRSVSIRPQGKVAKALGVLKGLLKGLPMQAGLFENAALTAAVRARIEAGDYDIVYVYYLRSAEVLPDGFGPGRKVVRGGHPVAAFLAMQLSQTLNTERIYRNQKPGPKKPIFLLEWLLLRRYEARVWQRFTRSVLIGPSDVEAVKAECRRAGEREIDNWVYGAHGTDIDRFFPARPDEIVPNRIVFSGSMLYAPNVQAVQWFVENCWASVRARVPQAELVIQGRDPLPEIQALNGRDGIIVTGTVPDVGAMIRSAAVCINPMRAAGGMQNKLIEYMACGKAIVATSVANEGILAPQDALLIADTSDTFADAVVGLLADRSAADALAASARAYVQDNWTWEAHFLKLEENFYQALKG